MTVKGKEIRTIVLPIAEEIYKKFVLNNSLAKELINALYEQSPELFPISMSGGYQLNGRSRISKKTGLQLRKIKVGGIVYRIRPSFILSYQRGRVDIASKGLFLLRFGVPFWALAVVLGKYAMWWYRLYISLGQSSIVGTTVYNTYQLPENLLADEHHIKIRGEKAYVATTAGEGCFLGMAVSSKADEASLQQAYGVFKEEAKAVNPAYEPLSVNTDGWTATQNAWQQLFPSILVLECFLHAFLKVRDRATKKLQAFFDTAGDKIWDCYRACSVRQLAQQIRRLREWATHKVADCPMRDNILKLCKKKKHWVEHFKIPYAHRTSNMIDRLMRAMKRHAFNSQMFHFDVASTTKNFRAFALLYNFTPSCPAVRKRDTILSSPAARLNGFVYHADWLQNLVIAASAANFKRHRNPL